MAGLPAIYENHPLFYNVDVDDAPIQARIVGFDRVPAFTDAKCILCGRSMLLDG